MLYVRSLFSRLGNLQVSSMLDTDPSRLVDLQVGSVTRQLLL